MPDVRHRSGDIPVADSEAPHADRGVKVVVAGFPDKSAAFALFVDAVGDRNVAAPIAIPTFR